MKKKYYSLLVSIIAFLAGLGYLPKVQATPIDSLSAVVTPLSCFGSGNGQIDLTVYGGTSPFTYYWNDGYITQDRTNLNQGTYSVTVTDQDGHTATGSYLVNQPDPLSLETAVLPVSCYGGDNGSINLTVLGGTAPFTYSWSNGSTTEDISQLTTGVYHIVVTDVNGCQLGGDVPVPGPDPTFQVVTAPVAVSCFGGTNGSISVNIVGGTSPYTFLWNDGVMLQNRVNLSAGSYYVTVTDAAGLCSAAPAVVNQPTAVMVSSSVTQVVCNASFTGGIDLTVSGGTPPYFYAWSNGVTTQDLTGVQAGTYSCVVTDNAGCSQQVGPFTLQDPPQLNLSYTSGNVDCNGNQNGFIDITVTGGVPAYTYIWSNGATTEDLTGIPAGIYTVTATDSYGCHIMQTVTITQPDPIVPNGNVSNISCWGVADGHITQSPAGGTPPYIYIWSNGSTTKDIYNLNPGNYTVTITDSHTCTKTHTYSITEPSYLWFGGVVTPVSCPGGSDGQIAVTIIGGTSPYSYLWNDGVTDKDRTALASGEYTMTVTDANNCHYSTTITVLEPSPITNNAVIGNVSCHGGNNGSINPNVTGGNAPYSYLWSTGDTTENISGLAAGTYSLTVTDTNSCTQNMSFIVGQPELLQVSGTVTNVSCPSGSDGSINTLTEGGTLPYSYLWNDNNTDGNRNGLVAGDYYLTVTDNLGCVATHTFTVGQPGVFSYNETINNVSCNGAADGSITLNPLGGTSPYVYNWSNGSVTNNATGLIAGTYTVTVTDNLGCINNTQFTVTQPDILTSTIQSTNVTCFGAGNGSIDLTTVGGTATYTWTWSNGAHTEDISGLIPGTYEVTITDSHNCTTYNSATIEQPASQLDATGTPGNILCNGAQTGSITLFVFGGIEPYTFLWNDGNTSKDRANITAGNYSVTITDNNGCQKLMNFVISEPTAITAVETITNVSCNGLSNGGISIVVSGGVPGYTYLWSTGTTDDHIQYQPAGNYTVSVTDGNNCQVVFTYNISEPLLLEVSGIAENIDCNGNNNGSITLTVAGGTPGYSYLWDSGETVADRTNLAPGTYSVTVTDDHLCTANTTFTITQPDPLAVSANVSDVTCYNANNGAIDVTVNGGTLDYTYNWNTGAITQDLNALAPGTYDITVTDNHGCTSTATYSVNGPAETVVLSSTQVNINCHGDNTGSIDLSVTGGTPAYSFAWSNGETTEDIINLTAGTYLVTVTDADLHCSVLSVTLTEPDAIGSTAVVVPPSCFGASDGNIDLTVTGGISPYTFEWTGSITTEDINSLAAGTYTVTITDHNSCVYVTSYNVDQPSAISISSTLNMPSCNGGNNGSIEIITSGGTPGYSWVWSNGETTESISGIAAGTYTITVTDAHACTTTATVQLSEPTAVQILTNLVVPVTCHGGNNGSIDLTITGGTPAYTYLWNDGVTTEDRADLTAGVYMITVSDNNGCTATHPFEITETFTINISGVVQDVTCLTGGYGSITLTVSGGTEPYAYLWNDNVTDKDRTDLAPGQYTVQVTDNNGCIQSAIFNVNQIDGVVIEAIVTNVSCYGFLDGSIEVSGKGGTQPYEWLWADGNTSTHLTGLGAGTYYVTVTDMNGCTSTDSFEVTQPAPPTGVIDPGSQILYCSGEAMTPIVFIPDNDPLATVTYSWTRNKVAQVSGLPASGTGEITGVLVNNTYVDQHITFTINVYVNGCYSGQYLAEVYVAARLDINFVHNDILCHGSTVDVQIQAIGGVPPYTGVQTVNLGAGTYTYAVSDNYGCTVTGTVVLTEPSEIIITGAVSPAYCSNQYNAGINVSVTGGVGTYSYLWNDGNTNEDRTGLLPGFYTVTVTDGNNCTATHTFNVGAFYNAPLGNLTGSPIGCYGQPNPVYVYLSGTPPWSFSYRVGTTTYNVNNNYLSTYTFYATITQPTEFELLLVHDSHCTGTVTSQPFTMDVAPAPTVSFTPTAPICIGQTSNIVVNLTGTAPWTITWFDGTPHVVSNITTPTYTIVTTPLTTTMYSIQSLADVYCSSTVTCPPVYQIVYPLPTALITGNPAVCSGNSATLQIHLTGNQPWQVVYNDGTMNHTIFNINTATYNLTLTPAVTSYYTLVSVNDFHCSGTVSGQAGILVHQRPTASWEGPDSACFNTDITLSLNLTGSPPWNLTWNDGSSHFVTGIMFTPFVINSHITTDKTFSITQLADAFCQSNNPSQLGEPKVVTSHQLPTAIITGPTVNCYGVGTDLEINFTGTPPWSVNWYDGANVTPITDITESPYLIHVDPATPTSYFLTFVEDNFCNGQILGSPVVLSVVPSPVLEIPGLGAENSVCEGAALTVTAHFPEGVPPYTINYIDGSGNFQILSNLDEGSSITFTPPPFPGNYVFTLLSVNSVNGCEVPINEPFTISVIPAPLVSAGNDTTVTLGDSFHLSAHINGGIPPYNVLWTPADFLDDPTSLTPLCTPLTNITYTLHVSDSIGCEVFDPINITVDMSRNISGYITYDNTVSTPMNDVKVKLLNNANVVIDSTITNAAGFYSFNNLADGNYHLKYSTTKEFGGVNATDALLVLKHFVHLQLLTGIKIPACDIDGSGFINAIDALSIAKRFTQQLTSFPIGDWYFQPVIFTIPTNVSQFDVKVLCVGDANGSYTPPSKQMTSLHLVENGEISCDDLRNIIIPVNINRPLEIGALSLVLNYPADLMTVTGVTLFNGDPVNYTASNGELRISWYNLDPATLGAFDVLLKINATLLSNVTGNSPFNLGNESELADGQAIPVVEAGLLIPKLNVPQGLLELSVNYPNPFSQQTSISYTIPSEGKVRITVYDALGREIAVPVNEVQGAGHHTLIFDGHDLPEGIYLYRLDYKDSSSEHALMRKMTLLK